MQIPHTPVLFNEVLEAFKTINEGYIIDCTLGYAGHSEGLLK
ncbi:MAG: 16S rRNA (cytosine(1402)-N(4))-methyltransferase, partial [Deltaproteobacteria bacterium HGW-Deltaproteobacteria-24]